VGGLRRCLIIHLGRADISISFPFLNQRRDVGIRKERRGEWDIRNKQQ
jgi:hypothetical protein